MDRRLLKSIEIIFENTDCAEIPVSAILGFSAIGVTETLCLGELLTQGKIIESSRDAEACRIDLNSNEIKKINVTGPGGGVTLFERLKTIPSITSYRLNMKNGYTQSISPPWEGDDDFRNECQKLKFYKYPIDVFGKKMKIEVAAVYQGPGNIRV